MKKLIVCTMVLVSGVVWAHEGHDHGAKSEMETKKSAVQKKEVEEMKKAKAQMKEDSGRAFFKVEGWDCQACPEKTAVAIKKMDGVAEVKVSLEQKYCAVTYNPDKLKPEQFASVIQKEGFKATWMGHAVKTQPKKGDGIKSGLMQGGVKSK